MNNKLKTTAQENIAKLPPYCYSIKRLAPDRWIVIRINTGERSYHVHLTKTFTREKAQTIMDLLNKELNITEKEIECIVSGSIFGYETPAANKNL